MRKRHSFPVARFSCKARRRMRIWKGELKGLKQIIEKFVGFTDVQKAYSRVNMESCGKCRKSMMWRKSTEVCKEFLYGWKSMYKSAKGGK